MCEGERGALGYGGVVAHLPRTGIPGGQMPAVHARRCHTDTPYSLPVYHPGQATLCSSRSNTSPAAATTSGVQGAPRANAAPCWRHRHTSMDTCPRIAIATQRQLWAPPPSPPHSPPLSSSEAPHPSSLTSWPHTRPIAAAATLTAASRATEDEDALSPEQQAGVRNGERGTGCECGCVDGGVNVYPHTQHHKRRGMMVQLT